MGGATVPLYEYECSRGHRFERFEKLQDGRIRRCPRCSGRARRVLSRPTLLHNRGVYVFDRETKDDVLRERPSSLKPLTRKKPF
jgi:putative FmdB family regulatory protein